MDRTIKVEVFNSDSEEAYITNHYTTYSGEGGCYRQWFWNVNSGVNVENDFKSVTDFPSVSRIDHVMSKQNSFTFLSLDMEGNILTRYKISKEI